MNDIPELALALVTILLLYHFGRRWYRRLQNNPGATPQRASDYTLDARYFHNDVESMEFTKEERDAIIQAYGKVLAPSSAEGSFAVARRESDLPFPKAIIRQAIAHALLDEPEEQYRKCLETGYVSLEFFVPDEEFTQATIFHDIAVRVTEGGITVRDLVGEMSRLNFNPELRSESSSKITQRMARSQQELETLKKLLEQANNHERVKGGLSKKRKQQLWMRMELELSVHEFLPRQTEKKRASDLPTELLGECRMSARAVLSLLEK